MTTADWFIAVFALLLTVRGFGTGFLVSALSLGGMLGGVYLGSKVASTLAYEGYLGAYGPLIVVGFVLVCAVLGEALARGVAARLRVRIENTFLGVLDGLGGAAFGAALGLLLAWVLGVFAQQAPLPTALQASLQRSEIVSTLDERLPSHTLLQAFARFDPLPQLEGPQPDVPRPDPALVNEPSVQRAASSVVRITHIEGVTGYAGSGWVAAPGLVVTNAHVVPGRGHTSVQPQGAIRPLPAEVLLSDERNDVAVLGVEGVDLPALQPAPPQPGERVVILGYPENGPFEARAGRVGDTRSVLSGDIFGGRPVERQVTSIRGVVRRGNSGGPVVNSQGQVVATIFGEGVGPADVGYGIPSSIVEEAVEEAQRREALVTNARPAFPSVGWSTGMRRHR
ncbi:MAG: MarP family serine protease [Actinomycetota bacterium]|nr:MarP family serine protease [Actinomycetota bacterium]